MRLVACASCLRDYFCLGQVLVDPLQLVFVRERDLDGPPLPRALDLDRRAEREAQLLFGGARVDVLLRGVGCALSAPRLASSVLLDERFGLAHRQAARDDVARDAALIGLGGERHDGARVAHRQRAGRDFAAHLVGQLQQAQVVGDRRAILADLRGDVFLRSRNSSTSR